MKRLIFFAIGILFAASGIAQIDKYEFVDIKPINGNQNVVFFYLSGIGGDEQANAVLTGLQEDNMVGDCWIVPAKDGAYRIKAQINRNVNADYIRKILLVQGADFDVTKVGVKRITESKKESLEKKYEDGRVSEHSPVFISTGNADFDNSVYDKAKQEWIKNYQDEYNKVYGVSTESEKK